MTATSKGSFRSANAAMRYYFLERWGNLERDRPVRSAWTRKKLRSWNTQLAVVVLLIKLTGIVGQQQS
jgi:hypothetical protein